MSASAFVLFLLFNLQDPRECEDVASCRAAAAEAASRGDYETFHDLAWRTVQKGKRNDPELMTLLARAQSLSGRPGDALVMLRRLAQMGVVTDAATNDDYRRVRALPAWPEVEALIKDAEAPPAPAPAAAPAPAGAKKITESKPEPPVDSPKASVESPKASIESRKAPAASRPAETAPAATFEDEPLPSTLSSIDAAGLVYDAVSRRFIIGNRAENNLIIYDDVFKRATSMVSAESAGFFGLRTIEIDPYRGDLWVVNSSAERGAIVHKLQLVSGRVLFEVPLPPELAPAALVDAAVREDGQVLLLDAEGRRILGLSPGHRNLERITTIEADVPTSLAIANGKGIFVAHRKGLVRIDATGRAPAAVRNAPAGLMRIRPIPNGLVAVQSDEKSSRLVRLRLDASGGRVARTDVLDATASISAPAAITVANGFVYYVTKTGGTLAIRRVRATK